MEHAYPDAAVDRLAFGPFELRPRQRLLVKNGAPIDIGGRALDLLVALVERPGRVVSKRELFDRVWPGRTVEDASLRFHMTSLRKLLGDAEGASATSPPRSASAMRSSARSRPPRRSIRRRKPEAALRRCR